MFFVLEDIDGGITERKCAWRGRQHRILGCVMVACMPSNELADDLTMRKITFSCLNFSNRVNNKALKASLGRLRYLG